MYETTVPQGLVLRKMAGSEEALKNLLLGLKRHKFTGYIEVTLLDKNETETGFVLLDSGQITDTFYFSASARDAGEKASKKIWQLSKNPKALMTLHGQVRIEEVEQAIRNLLEGKTEIKKESEIDVRIRVLTSKGIDTSEIEKIALKDKQSAEKILSEFEEFIRLSEEFNKFIKEHPEANERFPDLVSKLKDALEKKKGVEESRKLYSSLRQRVEQEKTPEAIELEVKHLRELEEIITRQREEEERKKKEAAVYNLIIQHKAKAEENPEPFCPRCGSPLDKDRQCVKCSAEDETFGKVVENLSMRNFIVGASNRFAYAVAHGISKYPGKLYNPVFIFGPEGSGKTHLLNAIAGNLQKGALSGKRIVFTNIPILLTVFEKYRDKQSNLVARLVTAESIFIDNFEEIAGKDELQKLLAGVLIRFVKEEKQVVIGSKISPTEIPKLETELLVCFTSGLLVNISEPDFETKKEILKRYAQEHGITLEPAVINYIAGINLSVNELSIILNRIFALASISNMGIDLALVKEALKEHTDKYGTKGKLKYNVQKGHSYLVEETRPNIVFQIVMTMHEMGYESMIFSRISPKRITEKHEKLQKASIYWLTEKESTAETIGHSLEKIVYAVEEKLNAHPNTVIALDGIEFLVSANGFDAVVKFIRKIVDMVAETEGMFLISLGESTLKEQETKILERELEVLKTD
ncbi:MAG: DnaA/Hda family protein [Thermoplasmata archaeon]|nr:DnaA/Hda family protein [Thermoplasmata archaeon]